MRSCRFIVRRVGFTLVELLVVIGIIALLISILLPSLNRAYQQANAVDCSSRMRQMCLGIQLYTNDNKGKLPYGSVNGPWSACWLPETITEEFKKVTTPGYNTSHPMFADKDADYPHSWWNTGIVNYNFNMALFPDTATSDPVTGAPMITQVPIARVRPAAEIIAGWDSMPCAGYDLNANEFIDDMVDAPMSASPNYFWWSTGLRRNVPSYAAFYNNQIPIVRLADSTDAHGAPDFRHLSHNGKGTAVNVMFLDGHVETRKQGNLQVHEFCFDHGDGHG